MPIPLSWSDNYTSGQPKGKRDFIRIGIRIHAPMGLTHGGGITRTHTDIGSDQILFSCLRFMRLAMMNQSTEIICSANMRPKPAL